MLTTQLFWKQSEPSMNIAEWLYASYRVNPTAPAIYNGTNLVANYGEFASHACILGHWLQTNHDLSAGDRIAIYAPNRPEYLILFYACWWIGAVAVPVNYMLHPQEAAWVAHNSAASVIFTDNGKVFKPDDLPATCTEISIDDTAIPIISSSTLSTSAPMRLDADALAWLFYTSGTTGRPKGVMLSHQNLMAMSLCYATDVDHVSPEHATLYAAPMSHGAGLYNFMYVRAGARHIVPESRGFNSEEILNLSKQLRDVSMFAAPTMCKRLVNQARNTGSDGDGIRTIVLGGGPLYAADLKEALEVLGPRFAQIYGQGESPMTITAVAPHIINNRHHPNWQARLESVGIAHSCIELRIVDESLQDLPTGNPGEILVRGPVVMQGYWRNPKATSETLVNGWLRTGDIGFIDTEGFLTLTDRSKDVIISGGSNVYPREVEEVLASHEQVFEAAVVGAYSPEWGEEVVAFVVAKGNQPLESIELDAWCVSQMASYKKPKRYIFVNDLPKNSYGKILKTELRQRLAQNSNAM